MRSFLALVLTFLFAVNATAQQTSNRVVAAGASDLQAFRILLNRDILLMQMSDEAEAAGHPNPFLRQQLAIRFGLNEDDNASLHRLATAYKREMEPLRAEVSVVMNQFRSRFPGGIVRRGDDLSPPPRLAELQREEDALTLRYRDLLHNSMREATFQALQSEVHLEFGGGSAQ